MRQGTQRGPFFGLFCWKIDDDSCFCFVFSFSGGARSSTRGTHLFPLKGHLWKGAVFFFLLLAIGSRDAAKAWNEPREAHFSDLVFFQGIPETSSFPTPGRSFPEHQPVLFEGGPATNGRSCLIVIGYRIFRLQLFFFFLGGGGKANFLFNTQEVENSLRRGQQQRS